MDIRYHFYSFCAVSLRLGIQGTDSRFRQLVTMGQRPDPLGCSILIQLTCHQDTFKSLHRPSWYAAKNGKVLPEGRDSCCRLYAMSDAGEGWAVVFRTKLDSAGAEMLSLNPIHMGFFYFRDPDLPPWKIPGSPSLASASTIGRYRFRRWRADKTHWTYSLFSFIDSLWYYCRNGGNNDRLFPVYHIFFKMQTLFLLNVQIIVFIFFLI